MFGIAARLRWSFALTLVPALLCACGGDESGGGGGQGGGGALPDPICLAPGPGPYPLHFTDVTVELGLGPDALRMTGGIVAITDIDGDRWPDLALSNNTGSKRDDPTAPTGLYHLYRNLGGTGFEDLTFSSGLFAARDGSPGTASTFVVFADVDGDGDADAFNAVFEDENTAAGLLDHSAIYFNDGSGHFTVAPEQSFSSGARDPAIGAAFLDYDRNGLLDLYVGHHYGTYGMLSSSVQDDLYAGDGLGGFFDVSAAAGVATQPFSTATAADATGHKPTWGVTACDLDGDGWTDLLTSSYGRQLNALYRNGGGVFDNLTLSSGYGSDDNQDYSDNQFYACYCQTHLTEPSCNGAPAPLISCSGVDNYWNPGMDDQPWRLGGNSSNAVCGDVDGDGDMDVLAVELAHWHIGQSSDKTELLINEGFPAAPFKRPGNAATGLEREHVASWNEGDLGAGMTDLDGDGRLDVLVASSSYPATYSLLWQQQADGRFIEVGEAAGTRIDRAAGVGFIDYDRDGDYDLVLGTSLMRWKSTDTPPAPDDAYAYLLRNDNGQNANKIMLRLAGAGGPDGANRDAIGARITVQAGGGTYLREVQAGGGHYTHEPDPLIIIGIGESCTADSLTVRWPNAAGDEVSFDGVLANYVVQLSEGGEISYQSLQEYTGQAASD